MANKIKLGLLALAVFGFVIFLYSQLTQKKQNLTSALGEVTQKIAQKIQNGAVGSSPITAKKEQESPKSFLTVEGIVRYTNEQRVQNGLKPLKISTILNSSALIKVQDMFRLQYFEHQSPSGKSVGDLAKDVGYSYILIGENLALGSFQNDQVLVQAWMDSPGHRANILNTRYTQIGVSVLKGVYKGQITWMAVQHFGFPLSSCPSPNQSVKDQVDFNNTKLVEMEKDLASKRSDLDSTKGDPSYNQKVEAYNNEVNNYNVLVQETKGLVNDYNTAVSAFNKCAGN